ncbi:MAG: LamG-like jellyroll fold domain-containing protein, partial [Limisphaerales bacterium]
VVSHLGYYSTNAVSGLATSHYVGIYNSDLANPMLLAQVDIPAGTAADVYTNGYYWVHLDPPLLLSSNTKYVLAGLAEINDGDNWVNLFSPTWNAWFVGGQTGTTRAAVYGPGDGSWPPSTGFSQNGNNNTYGAPQLGYISLGSAHCGVQTTNFVGGTLSVLGFAAGQEPITNTWWEAASPNPIAISSSVGDYATLSIPDATSANDGAYFMTSSNALGGEQSANVSVTITAYPVAITTQPTNETVFQNYQANFFMVATGTPPISYQWFMNGTPIPGANSTNCSVTATLGENGDVFSCLASNFVSGAPYTVQGSNATLTVIPNLAPPQEFLHGDILGLANNTYEGQQGVVFTTGSKPVLVTALGYYAWPANRVTNGDSVSITFSTDHHVGIFTTNGVGDAAGTYVPVSNLLCSVDVPATTLAVVNGYAWQPLNPAVLLSSNTTYVLVAETKSDADWGTAYVVPDLNPYFATRCLAVYGANGWGSSAYLGGEYGGDAYSAPNLAILTNTASVADILPTNVVVYAGSNATLTAYVAGQPPMGAQWYTNTVALANQTNLALTLTDLTLADSSSNYYVEATSPGGDVQSDYGSVTVLPDYPTFVQNVQPLSQSAYNDQTVQFSVSAGGLATLSYQWYFEETPIPGATNSTLTLSEVSSNNDGSYYLVVTNSYGSATSSNASLTVEYPAAPGTYPSVVMGPNLLLYYPLNDYNGGGSTATNWGTGGFPDDGTYYIAGCSSVAGPPQVNWPGDDYAVNLDGSSGNVSVPPLIGVAVSSITIAAWVNDPYPFNNPDSGQYTNAAIFFQRSASVFGLSVNPDTNGADSLSTTWGGTWRNWTGLDLPTNEWALVAMVISPTNWAAYLDSDGVLQSTNITTSNPSATFAGNSYIGWDTAGGTGGRLWEGAIADVMVFDQALPPSAIQSLYTGIVAAPISLTISPVANKQLTVSWAGGTLLEATNVLGPWTSVPDATGGSGSYTAPPSNNAEFYRVQQ